jgi:membrane fusion protein, multidrug efflux system
MFRTIPLAALMCVVLIPAAGAQAPPPPPVTVASPLAERITTWDEYSGHFEAVQSSEVRPRVSGFIDKVHFKDGEIVKAGDPLFTLDRRLFELAVKSAEAEVARTKAQVSFQETEVERAAPLVKTGAVTKRDFTQRSANLLTAEAQSAAAEAALRTAQLNLEWTTITAPISGRISDRKIDVGNLVVASETVLTNIVTLDPIHFLFDASEADFLRYTRMNLNGTRPSSRGTSNPVRVKLADEKDFTHIGQMDFVDNQLNTRSGTMRGRAVLKNEKQLFVPGVFGRLKLFGGEVDALLIPDSAILSDQTRKIVFVIGDDDIVAAKSLELGPIAKGLRVVSSGLEKTDRIVIDGLANPMVRPGTKVTPEPGQIQAVTQ